MKLTNIFKHNFFRTELTIKVNVKKRTTLRQFDGHFQVQDKKEIKK